MQKEAVKAHSFREVTSRLKELFGSKAVPAWVQYAVDMSVMNKEVLAELHEFMRPLGKAKRFGNSCTIMFEREEDAVLWLIKKA